MLLKQTTQTNHQLIITLHQPTLSSPKLPRHRHHLPQVTCNTSLALSHICELDFSIRHQLLSHHPPPSTISQYQDFSTTSTLRSCSQKTNKVSGSAHPPIKNIPFLPRSLPTPREAHLHQHQLLAAPPPIFHLMRMNQIDPTKKDDIRLHLHYAFEDGEENPRYAKDEHCQAKKNIKIFLATMQQSHSNGNAYKIRCPFKPSK